MPRTKTNSSGRIQRTNSEGKREDFLFIEKGIDTIDEDLNAESDNLDTDVAF